MSRADIRRFAGQASFHPVSGGAVVYHSDGQRLFALNATAALVWLNIRDGASDDMIARDLETVFGVPFREAEAWCGTALRFIDQASKAAVLASLPAPANRSPSVSPSAGLITNRYRLLGQTVRLSASMRALTLIEGLMGGLTASGQSDEAETAVEIRESGAGFDVFGDGSFLATVEDQELVGAVERFLIEDLVPRMPHLLAFHAAILKGPRETVLFPAPSGSGKSTLSAALANSGWLYGSDEMAFFHDDRRWTGLPFRPCIKAENFGRVEALYPDLRTALEHDRFGRRVKFVPIDTHMIRDTIVTVVFPDYDARRTTTLQAIPTLEGLERLLQLCVHIPTGFMSAEVERVIAWHDAARYFNLSIRHVHEAVGLLNDVY